MVVTGRACIGTEYYIFIDIFPIFSKFRKYRLASTGTLLTEASTVIEVPKVHAAGCCYQVPRPSLMYCPSTNVQYM